MRALVKLEQVLPAAPAPPRQRAADRDGDAPPRRGPTIDPETLTAIAGACRDRERLRFAYRSRDGDRRAAAASSRTPSSTSAAAGTSSRGTATATTGAPSASTASPRLSPAGTRFAARELPDRRRRRLRRGQPVGRPVALPGARHPARPGRGRGRAAALRRARRRADRRRARASCAPATTRSTGWPCGSRCSASTSRSTSRPSSSSACASWLAAGAGDERPGVARMAGRRDALRRDGRPLAEALGLARRPNRFRADLAAPATLLAVALDLARELLLAQVDRVAKVARAILRAQGHTLESQSGLRHLVVRRWPGCAPRRPRPRGARTPRPACPPS